MATPSDNGTASASASEDVSSVPKIAGHAPNWPATGSQVDDAMKPNPKRPAAGSAPRVSSASSASSSAGIVHAAPINSHLKSASPRDVPDSVPGLVFREAPVPRP